MPAKMISFIGPQWENDDAEDIEGASEIGLGFLRSLKGEQLQQQEAAGLLSLFLWGPHNGTWYMTFWALSSLAATRSAMERVQKEVDGCTTQICQHEAMATRPRTPLIDSAIIENFGWETTTSIVRRSTKDTHIPFGDASIVIQRGPISSRRQTRTPRPGNISRTRIVQSRSLLRTQEGCRYRSIYAHGLGRWHAFDMFTFFSKLFVY